MKNTINYAGLSMNDIIFQDRNKDYGAYELRESYNRRIKRALFGAAFIAASLCSYQSVFALIHPAELAEEHHVISCPIDIPIIEKVIDIPKPPKPVEPPKPKGTIDPATTNAAATLVSAADAKAADSIPTNEQLAKLAISDHDSKGTTTGTTVGDPNGDLLAIAVAKPAPVPSEPLNFAEFMPEYPGGEKAMMAFIAGNIRYPDMDVQLGMQGRVTVGFVIDETGNITDIKVVRGLTRTLNEESMRVVSKLKKFKPGMQGGHAVKVRYNLPISYALRDND